MADSCYFPNTYALVLCGGNSSRMGTDKSMLQYYGKPQRYHVYDMLHSLCEKVFISCSNDQATHIQAGYHSVTDGEQFGDIGPMAALLTAFSAFPGKHVLLIGCDYPFLNLTELAAFAKLCKISPASFYNPQAVIYESMLAWYPHSCAAELLRMFNSKLFSLQNLLRNKNAVKYLPADSNCILSVDTMEAYEEAVRQINEH